MSEGIGKTVPGALSMPKNANPIRRDKDGDTLPFMETLNEAAPEQGETDEAQAVPQTEEPWPISPEWQLSRKIHDFPAPVMIANAQASALGPDNLADDETIATEASEQTVQNIRLLMPASSAQTMPVQQSTSAPFAPSMQQAGVPAARPNRVPNGKETPTLQPLAMPLDAALKGNDAKQMAPATEAEAQRTNSSEAVTPAKNGLNTRPVGLEAAVKDAVSHDTQPEIRVLSIQRAPAPAAALPVASTAVPTETAVAFSTRTTPAEAANPAGPSPSQSGKAIQTLTIQIHPAELGLVTAKLKMVSNQLTVDLQVETNEARQRLSSDSDAIVKALRTLGYDIDRVTIQQPAQTGANTGAGANGRDGSFQSFSGQEEHRGQASGNTGQGQDKSGSNRASSQRQAEDEADQSGLYI